MKDLLRDYLDGRLSRRRFFRQLMATGLTAAAARSAVEAADTERAPTGQAAHAASRFHELTMPLDHEYMADEILPTATPFILAPAGDPNKGITVGTETGTCLTLPSQFSAFRKITRLHEVAPEKLVLRETVVVNIPREEGQEISSADVDRALATVDFRREDAVLVRTGWGDKEWYRAPGTRYITGTPRFSVEGATRLARSMAERGSDLLLTDLALIGWPSQHMMREWLSAIPRPRPWPSPEADIYIRT